MFNVLNRLKIEADSSPKSNQKLKAEFDKILSLDPKAKLLGKEGDIRKDFTDSQLPKAVYTGMFSGEMQTFNQPELKKFSDASFKNGFKEIENLRNLIDLVEKELNDQKVGIKSVVKLFDNYIEGEIKDLSTYRKNLDKIKSQLEDYQKSS